MRTAQGRPRSALFFRRTSFRRCRQWAGIFLFILLSAAACERGADVVPHYLIGTWKTSAPRYADRSMRFGQHTLVLGVGDGREVSYRIEKIEMKQAGDKVFSLYYRDPEGEKGMITFTYRSASGGTLQLKNRNQIWKKHGRETTDHENLYKPQA